jgi:hypothetical protein
MESESRLFILHDPAGHMFIATAMTEEVRLRRSRIYIIAGFAEFATFACNSVEIPWIFGNRPAVCPENIVHLHAGFPVVIRKKNHIGRMICFGIQIRMTGICV